MKVDLYTYNRPLVQYHQPTFMERPIEVDWNSDSGKKLEKVLVWMGASAMASIMAYYSFLTRTSFGLCPHSCQNPLANFIFICFY